MANSDDMMAFRYLKSLRKLEYAQNCLKNASIWGKIIWAYRKWYNHRLSIKYDVFISPNMVGYGLKLPHIVGGGIIVNCKQMGNYCGINVGVVVGKKKDNDHRPIIGDNVLLLTGCKVIGGVSIGNNAIIAPNSVVIKDVEEYTAVAGIPARLIKKYDKE